MGEWRCGPVWKAERCGIEVGGRGWDSSARSGSRGSDQSTCSQEPSGGPSGGHGATKARLLEAWIEGVGELLQGERVE